MLEACIEMWLETQVDNDGVMVAVDVRIDTIKTLEDLEDERAEGTWERYTYWSQVSITFTRGGLIAYVPMREGNMFSLSTLA